MKKVLSFILALIFTCGVVGTSLAQQAAPAEEPAAAAEQAAPKKAKKAAKNKKTKKKKRARFKDTLLKVIKFIRHKYFLYYLGNIRYIIRH